MPRSRPRDYPFRNGTEQRLAQPENVLREERASSKSGEDFAQVLWAILDARDFGSRGNLALLAKLEKRFMEISSEQQAEEVKKGFINAKSRLQEAAKRLSSSKGIFQEIIESADAFGEELKELLERTLIGLEAAEKGAKYTKWLFDQLFGGITDVINKIEARAKELNGVVEEKHVDARMDWGPWSTAQR